MQTIIMAIAIIKKDSAILLRKFDPSRNPYAEPWGLFGGRLEGDGPVEEVMNVELKQRWNITISINERLWWGEDIKDDHDNVRKRFLYIDALCSLASGEPSPINPNEELKWVKISDLKDYEFNAPTKKVLQRLEYLK